ncbi:hypothetical protein SAMN05660909_03550 [Chitinophaga terrae (ex Kim and Jung 2007)]|uniref:Uncharacterized protein n=1 Tax=Chitinophaga terrae (ex Kim and Jung 2007) TaxID=408074 RepID=A0A1H4E8J2_9BACT|nr:hypothetical protein [Chitinophaga terrae (ex Kim and Jung 2007)]SEA80662.1 hypothetical protein SAMN05660909_03550 [Chitinophaga terrae (ex Kim and Jung 2007)]
MKSLPWKAMSVIALCCIFSDKLFAQQLKLGMQPTILDKDAVLELNSDKQGLLMPRVPKSRITAGGLLFGAKAGMLVYVVDDASIYLKKTTGWVRITDFSSVSAGTGISIDAAGVISNTGVTSFKTRTGAVSPQEGDYNLDLLDDVVINTASLANNQVLSFDQATSKWTNKTALTSIVTAAPVTGAGTAASPLSLIAGTTANQVLKWNGTAWTAGTETTSARKLTITAGRGIKQVTPAGAQDLTADRSWTIDADNTNALWNANKLQGLGISTTAPADGQILKWNAAKSLYEPMDDSTGGVTFAKLTTPDAAYADQPFPKVKLKIWEAQGGSPVTNGPAGVTAHAWTILSFRNTSYTTQLFFDKANLAIKEWGGNNSPLTSNGGNPWYKAVLTHGDNVFTDGGIVFAKKTSDASVEVSQDAGNFFYDFANKRLGIGTNTPANALEIAGAAYTGGSLTPATSGLRLKNLATATPDPSNTKVLSINAQGDVIVTNNAANDNWLTTGNVGAAAGSFLGNRDDVPMIIKSNNQTYLEFGRRDLLGLTDTESYGPEYSDVNQKVTHLRSALQFESSSRLYKPMFFVDQYGNFRMKGSAASDDIFEFGATGSTVNDGGFDFIIGDDGDEPIIFKSYNYNGRVFSEMMRIQLGKVGIGLTAEPAKVLHVNARNDAIRLQNLATTTTANNLLTIDANGDVRQVNKNSTSSFTSMNITGTNNALNVGTVNNMIRINSGYNGTINGITNGTTPIDGQTITFYCIATTGTSLTFNNNSNNAALGNRIYTPTGAAVTISNQGNATLVYSAQDNAWIMISFIL